MGNPLPNTRLSKQDSVKFARAWMFDKLIKSFVILIEETIRSKDNLKEQQVYSLINSLNREKENTKFVR